MEPASAFLAYRKGLDKGLFHLLGENREIISGIGGIVLVPESFPNLNRYMDLLKELIESRDDQYASLTLKVAIELLEKAEERKVLPLAYSKLEGFQSGRINKQSIEVRSPLKSDWGNLDKYKGSEIGTAIDRLYAMSADFSKIPGGWRIGNIYANNIGLEDWAYFPTEYQSAQVIENCMPVLEGYLKNGYVIDHLFIQLKSQYAADASSGEPGILLTLDPNAEPPIFGTRPNYPYLRLKNINLDLMPESVRDLVDKGLDSEGGTIVPEHEFNFALDCRIGLDRIEDIKFTARPTKKG